MTIYLFDDRICELGEGPLWHPQRSELFWVDVLGNNVLKNGGSGPVTWTFDEMVSALGWIDKQTLLVASENGLNRLTLGTGRLDRIVDIESDRKDLRSNDGRTDPWGGFWIGTMSKYGGGGGGAVYRWFAGELRLLFSGIKVPNGTCFDRSRSRGYIADSVEKKLYKIELDANGWPVSDPIVHVDLSYGDATIDGAVVDASGVVWAALWDGSAIARFAPNGRELGRIDTGVKRPTCPAFGGPSGTDLYVTSAAVGLSQPDTTLKEGQTGVFRGLTKANLEPAIDLN